MSVSGLTASPSRCSLVVRNRMEESTFPQISAVRCISTRKIISLNGSHSAGQLLSCVKRSANLIVRTAEASYGDMTGEPAGAAVFPRINIGDPYKRLGISREASEEEIQAARNFLISKYGWHKPSVDAIESAHDKIILQKFYERRKAKVDIKKKVREVRQSRFVQAVLNRFQTPATKFIVRTAIAFMVLGALTLLFPTEEGPTIQVALSLITTIYFIHDRLKSKIRALLYGVGAFVVSWVFGTFLMVCVIPPVVKGPRAFEVMSSLISYVLLWVSSTYLK